ncbi:MAG: pyridoxal-dependent decarboxylase [Planctomycetota bacterium]|nr:pyridoxal-dependent decarboxylase [Planctomycetota bacterium]
MSFSSHDFVENVERVGKLLSDFLESSRESAREVVRLDTVSQYRETLGLQVYLDRAGTHGDVELIEPFLNKYLDSLIRLNDPRFIGHQVARPHFASALADLVNGMTNNGMAVYEMGPGQVTLEKFILDWLLKCLPQPAWQGADGILTSGGSIANLTALLAARGVKDPASWEDGNHSRLAFLLPETSHYCLKRAVCILGYGESSIFPVPTNAWGQIRVDQLEDSFERAVSAGRKPVLVAANAASTPTGLYDDLYSVGQFARQRELWFHVDGAHGASALVSEKHRGLLRGIEFADSLVWDQHKLLQTSALCTAVLFREAASLDRIFQQKASYLNQSRDEESPNLFLRTLECTKVPMGLKFYLCLLACGQKGIAEFVDVLFERTREFHDLIQSRKGFSCPCQPQSNILCFQYRPDLVDPFTVREKIIRQGDFYLTQTELNGEKYFRFTVASPETDRAVVTELLETIEKVAADQPGWQESQAAERH